jgi:S-adenosylmethionine:tRNA ribosyltransferase-isomerase
MHPKDLAISNFTYQLPNGKIAAFPLSERDASKLLVYKDGMIQQDVYKNIASHIPANSLLVFNNTKVIQARILFQKETGGVVEIFCLEPMEEIKEYNLVMNKKESIRWKCMIGGAGKWKSSSLIKQIDAPQNGKIILSATLVEKLSDAYVVELSWLPINFSFAEVLEQFGDMPLPPYIKRKADLEDKERYQTIYAQHQGSVAAPTAGLHFTETIFESFTQKNIAQTYVTLHVGAGTFKPVKAASMLGHEMHSEWMDVSIETIKQLISNTENTTIAVGTTSLRTIESLYWMGAKAKLFPQITTADLMIQQWDVYEPKLQQTNFTSKEALQSLLQWMDLNKLQQLFLPTQILIAPGYQYKVAQAIITNFHQPQSTLLLLVAAAVGDNWNKIYDYALENDFRFLSYGDGSLLFCATPNP